MSLRNCDLVLRVFAVAINAVMFSTGSARHSDLFTHGVASTVDTDCSVSFTNANSFGEISETPVAEINRNERFSIFRL